jgi:hypothetical protein
MKRCNYCNKRVKDGSGKGIATISGYFCDKKCAIGDMRRQCEAEELAMRMNKEQGWWTKE